MSGNWCAPGLTPSAFAKQAAAANQRPGEKGRVVADQTKRDLRRRRHVLVQAHRDHAWIHAPARDSSAVSPASRLASTSESSPKAPTGPTAPVRKAGPAASVAAAQASIRAVYV